MAKIEMLDDEGTVTETIDAHVCSGSQDECETPARCEEDCGEPATTENPVYVWTSALSGMEYFVCGRCLAIDAYARIKSS